MVRPQYRGQPGDEGSQEVTDLTTNQVVEQCQSYWLGSGVAADTAQEMATELRSHLDEATSAGKTVEAVTGADLEMFAEAWAEASRDPKPARTPTPPTLPVQSETKSTAGLWAGLGAIVLLVIAVALLAPHDESVDQSTWVTMWLIAAAVLAIGELVTAGFFLLPFAAGAADAGVLALLSISVPVQIITFVLVSVLALWLLQRFASDERHHQIRQPAGSIDRVNRDHVRMHDRRGRAGFAGKSLAGRTTGGQMRSHYFDRHIPSQIALIALQDDAHSAASDHFQNLDVVDPAHRFRLLARLKKVNCEIGGK